jgi:hypothetical protein
MQQREKVPWVHPKEEYRVLVDLNRFKNIERIKLFFFIVNKRTRIRSKIKNRAAQKVTDREH